MSKPRGANARAVAKANPIRPRYASAERTARQRVVKPAAKTFVLETETGPKGQAGTQVPLLHAVRSHQP